MKRTDRKGRILIERFYKERVIEMEKEERKRK